MTKRDYTEIARDIVRYYIGAHQNARIQFDRSSARKRRKNPCHYNYDQIDIVLTEAEQARYAGYPEPFADEPTVYYHRRKHEIKLTFPTSVDYDKSGDWLEIGCWSAYFDEGEPLKPGDENNDWSFLAEDIARTVEYNEEAQ